MDQYADIDTIVETVTQDMNFAITTQEDLKSIVPDIAWQTARGVRFNGGDVEIVRYALLDSNPVFTFDDSNTQENSVILTTLPLSEVYTRIEYVNQGNNYLKQPKHRHYKRNVAKYGENEITCEFYVYHNEQNSLDYFSFWLNRITHPWCRVKLTGYLDSFKLDILDVVEIDLGTVKFYDTTKGYPVTHYLQGAVEQGLWNGTGYIEEINARLDERLIDYTIRLPFKLGDIA